MTETSLLPVEPVDREAAHDLLVVMRRLPPVKYRAEFMAGKWDGYPVVQHMVRHRLAERDRAAGEGWQDIATAPRDGTQILAAIEVHSIKGGKWWERDVIWADDETGDIHRDCESAWAFDDYSHWRPLPEPPATAIRSPSLEEGCKPLCATEKDEDNG